MFNGHMGHAPLPVNRQIDTTENITFEQIRNLVGGNKTILCSVAFVYFLPPLVMFRGSGRNSEVFVSIFETETTRNEKRTCFS